MQITWDFSRLHGPKATAGTTQSGSKLLSSPLPIPWAGRVEAPENGLLAISLRKINQPLGDSLLTNIFIHQLIPTS